MRGWKHRWPGRAECSSVLGTEPLVRVMIEGKDKAAIGSQAVKIAKLIEQKLGGK